MSARPHQSPPVQLDPFSMNPASAEASRISDDAAATEKHGNHLQGGGAGLTIHEKDSSRPGTGHGGYGNASSNENVAAHELTAPGDGYNGLVEPQAANLGADPEKSARARLVLLGAFAVSVVSVGYTSSYGVFETYYLEVMLPNESASNLAWLGSFTLFCMFVGSFGTGVLMDRYGPQPLVIIGSIITVIAMFMTSLCTTYYQLFLAQALLLGIGIAFIFCPALVTLSLYFQKNRGLAMGVAVSGSSVGGVIWPIALTRLLREVGFGWTLRIVGFIMLGMLIIASLTIRGPIRNGPRVPQPINLAPARNPVILLQAFALFFIYLGLFTPLFYITAYTISLGLDTNMAFYMVAIFNAASFFGRIMPGFLADIYGPFNLMITSAASSAIICFCWTKATSIAGIVVFCIFFGFSSGAIVSLQSVCAVKAVKKEEFGTAVGVVMAIMSVAGLIGTPINGKVLDRGYLALSCFSGTALLIGGIITCVAKFKLAGTLFSRT